jgi:iron-sulfur cluster assembly accessory protein
MEAIRFMINLTPVAATKVKEIMNMQTPAPTALRVAVVGGGCSGFQYHMAFENQTNETDEVADFDGLKVAVDQMSSMYLDGVEIDYVETLEGAGFKFNNPNVKSTCGCVPGALLLLVRSRSSGTPLAEQRRFQNVDRKLQETSGCDSGCFCKRGPHSTSRRPATGFH